MSKPNSSTPADDRPSQNGGGTLQLPVKLDATQTEYSHSSAPQHKIQGQIPVQQGPDLVVDLSDLTQAGDWYVDTDANLYIRGKSYTQGTPDSRYVKVQQIVTDQPRVVPVESAKIPLFSIDVENSLKEVGVSATMSGAAVTDLVERYANSATEVITHELLENLGGIVDLLTHANGTRVSVDIGKPYAGWQQDVQQIKAEHGIEGLEPQDKDHVRAMVRPVLGVAWGEGEYEARLEVSEPDLDRLYELAEEDDCKALTLA